jgi:hypothetical protein
MASALSQLFGGFLLAKEAAGVKETTLETYRTALLWMRWKP